MDRATTRTQQNIGRTRFFGMGNKFAHEQFFYKIDICNNQQYHRPIYRIPSRAPYIGETRAVGCGLWAVARKLRRRRRGCAGLRHCSYLRAVTDWQSCDSECMTLEHSYSTLVPFARIAHLFGKSQKTNEYRIFIRHPPRIDQLSKGSRVA